MEEQEILKIKNGYLTSTYKGVIAIKISSINHFEVQRPKISRIVFSFFAVLFISFLWSANSNWKDERSFGVFILATILNFLFHLVWFITRIGNKVVFSNHSDSISIPEKLFDDEDDYLNVFEKISQIQAK